MIQTTAIFFWLLDLRTTSKHGVKITSIVNLHILYYITSYVIFLVQEDDEQGLCTEC